ncbi:MAG: isocitrate lyase/phosphoenolpyruvate mutase family protein [Candidatus Omnitrophota bacterium]|nr:isocitrate lyase/phosphoenolpyruvate mutase family protein [Candidatus Omnitrophota bacterium]
MNDKSKLLRQQLKSGSIVRVMGAHNGLGAKLIERAGFDAVWSSGLEISTAHALPDANILTMTETFEAARGIHEATALPVVCDCDTGYGNAANVKHMVRKYEAAGLAAAVMEDKIFPKVNSFIPGRQDLVSISEFCGKLRAAKEAQQTPGFMVFARVEALIAGLGMEEALRRARAYAEAGADGIVIHSKSSSPEEVLQFARAWDRPIPLVSIPTTYFKITAHELEKAGFRMVIYANQGLRASIRAMESAFRTICETGTTESLESQITPMKEVFELQGMKDMKADEERFSGRDPVQAVIPAGRDHQFQPDLKNLLEDKPLCMLDIQGKTLIERQMDALHSVGISKIHVITGHLREKIKADGAQLLFNPDYGKYQCAQSILFAREHLRQDTLVLYSDILFDRKILDRLLQSPHAITLVVDRSYRSLPFRDKTLDRVALEPLPVSASGRRLSLDLFKPVQRIGHRWEEEAAPTHEFVGIALFRRKGLAQLIEAWEDALEKFADSAFQEAPTAWQADLTDLLQYLVDRGIPVHSLEIDQGWSEIHSRTDYDRALTHFQTSSKSILV